jgi:hypothetical protein
MAKECSKCKKKIGSLEASHRIDGKRICLDCGLKPVNKIVKQKELEQSKGHELKCNCGKTIDSNAVICLGCGRQLKQLSVDISDNPWGSIGFRMYWGTILITMFFIWILIKIM